MLSKSLPIVYPDVSTSNFMRRFTGDLAFVYTKMTGQHFPLRMLKDKNVKKKKEV